MENPEHKYELIFSGQITEGADPEKVREIAARVFHATPDQLAQLFSGNTIILKNNLSQSGANTFREKLVAVGFVCGVRPMAGQVSAPAAPATNPAPAAAPPAQVEASVAPEPAQHQEAPAAPVQRPEAELPPVLEPIVESIEPTVEPTIEPTVEFEPEQPKQAPAVADSHPEVLEDNVPEFDYDLSETNEDNEPLDYDQTIAEIDADLELESESALDFSDIASNTPAQPAISTPHAPDHDSHFDADDQLSASPQTSTEVTYTSIPTDSDELNLFDELLDDDDLDLDLEDQNNLSLEETESDDISIADMEYLLHENEDEDDHDQPITSMKVEEEIKFEPVPTPAVQTQMKEATPQQTHAPAATQADDWSIAPAGSQIDIEPHAPPPPMPDTSHLDVQERVGYLFDQNRTPPPPAPDTSHLSLVDED